MTVTFSIVSFLFLFYLLVITGVTACAPSSVSPKRASTASFEPVAGFRAAAATGVCCFAKLRFERSKGITIKSASTMLMPHIAMQNAFTLNRIPPYVFIASLSVCLSRRVDVKGLTALNKNSATKARFFLI
jgi:hypothetical protein